MTKIPDCKGYYTLIMRIQSSTELYIGSLGRQAIDKGYYIYIGSAMGRGGIKQRVKRHLLKQKTKKWHIDYITSLPHTKVLYVITICTLEENKEEEISQKLSKKLIPYIKKFGATDKKSYTHLFKCPSTLKKCVKDITQILLSIPSRTNKTQITIVEINNHTGSKKI